jgi:O-antigen ligase
MKSHRILALLSLVVLAGSLASLVVVAQQQHELMRGWENATDRDSVLPYAIPRPGVNADLLQYNPSQLRSQLSDMRDVGVVWVRQEFQWKDIEPSPGDYDWAKLDALVEAFETQPELELIAVLVTTPEWARESLARDSVSSPPANIADFAGFVEGFTARYGAVIDYYQIWDEPNLTAAWGGLDPKAADYVALLQAAYTTIHEVDENATVIAAGLAPTVEQGPENYSDLLFLHAIYENGGAPYFDAVAAKPYGFDTGPYDRRVSEDVLNFSRFILLREEMVRNGDSDKTLWASQFGWNALPDNWEGDQSIWGSHTREEQLAYISAAYIRAADEWPWAGGLILEHWQPNVSYGDPLWGFSLIPQGADRIDTSATLFPYVGEQAAHPGRHHPSSPFAAYAGDWEFGELGADFGQSGNSETTFVFHGTEIALELRQDNYRAYLIATVDDEQANALPNDNDGNTYIVLTSDDLQPHTVIVPVARNLEAGIHTLHLKAVRGWDQWALAGFRVAVEPGPDEDMLPIAFFALLAFLAAASLVMLTRRLRFSPSSLPLKAVVERLGCAGQRLMAGVASAILMIGMVMTLNNTLPAIIRRDPPGLILGVITAGVLYYSPWFALTITAGLVLGILIFQRLEIGLFLVIFWAPFFLFPIELYQLAFPMAEICLLITAVGWALSLAVRWAENTRSGFKAQEKQPRANMNAIDWGILLLVVIAIISVTWSQHRAEALRELRTTVLEPALFYVLLRTTIRKPENALRLVDSFLLSASAVSIISLTMYLVGDSIIVAEGGSQRLAGIYGSPNNIGLLIGRAMPFALAYVLTSAKPRKPAGLMAGGVMLVTVALTQSVGALLLGIPAGLFVVTILWRWRAALASIVTAIILSAVALIPLSNHPRFARLTDLSGGTSFFRIRLWQSSIQMIQDRTIRGLGLDQFLYAYRGHYILPDAWQEPNLSHPHNILLDFWTRLGLGGVIALAWIQVAFWRTCWRSLRVFSAAEPSRTIILGAMGSMAALITHGLVDNSVFVIDLSYIFVMLLALPTLLQPTPVDVTS